MPERLQEATMDIIEKDGKTIVKNHIDGQVIYFTIEHTNDVVQRQHQRGLFYEGEEIACMADHVPDGAAVMDIGCNVGNHALWFAKYRNASKIYLFEPNPAVLPVLRSNIVLNKLGDVVVEDHLGVGLSDKAAGGFELKYSPKNLGGARMVPDGGDLEVRPGDDLIGEAHIDFMKIDVARMELEVLSGLSKTIARCRPNIFVEVDSLHSDRFKTWLADNGYKSVQTFQPTKRTTSHMCVPR